MIGQIIQSYLVSLGVHIDKPGFQQADATIRQTGDNIDRVTAGMARNFVKASTIIASAMASVTASAVGLMKATANEDLAMQKYARSMMMGEEAAWNMKKATDALGESINDISLTPELMERYKKLTVDGSQMMVGGDFKETMKNFRDLMFEFTRLKQEASYALNWVGYYLMKYLQRPLADIKEKFRTFNDMVIKNMSVWTEKVARGIYYVLEVGRHFLQFLVDVGRHLRSMWNSFPEGVKKAIVAITALQAVLSAGPLGRAIMLISTLLLLIDDYYGYMEGKDALLGKYWDKLNNFLDTAKTKYEELKATVEPYWDKFIGYIEQAQKWFSDLIKTIKEWSDSTGAGLLQKLIEECEEWWKILSDLYDTIENGIKVTWQTFMETLEKNDTINDVQHLLERLWHILVMLYQAVKDVIDGIIQLANEIAKTEEWKEFIAVVAELFDGIVELFDAIMELIETALTALFGEFHKTDIVLAFRDVLRAVLKIFTGIIRAVNWVIGLFRDLFKLVAGSTTFKKFWEEVGGLIGDSIEKLGTFSNKLRELWDELTAKSAEGSISSGYGSKISDDPRVAIAERIAEITGADPALVYGNMVAESGYWHGPDTLSTLAKEHHNYGGIKYYGNDPSKIAFAASDGGVFRHFNSDEEYAQYAASTLKNYSKAVAARNEADYVAGLKDRDGDHADYTGGADAQQYTANVKSGADFYRNLPNKSKRSSSEDGFESTLGYDTSNNYQKFMGIWSSAEGMNAGWNSEVTNVRDILPRTKDFLNYLGPEMSALGYRPVITGGAEIKAPNGRPYHDLSLDYSHAKGYKIDIDGDSIPQGSGGARRLKYIVEHIYGGKIIFHDGHWDITIPPGKGMRKATPPANYEPATRPESAKEAYQPPESDEGKSIVERVKDWAVKQQDSFDKAVGVPIYGTIRKNFNKIWNGTNEEENNEKSIAETVGDGVISVAKTGWGMATKIGDMITGSSSGFIDSRSAAVLGGVTEEEARKIPSSTDVDIDLIKAFRKELLKRKDSLPTEYVEDMMGTIRDALGEKDDPDKNAIGRMNDMIKTTQKALDKVPGLDGKSIIKEMLSIPGGIIKNGGQKSDSEGKNVIGQIKDALGELSKIGSQNSGSEGKNALGQMKDVLGEFGKIVESDAGSGFENVIGQMQGALGGLKDLVPNGMMQMLKEVMGSLSRLGNSDIFAGMKAGMPNYGGGGININIKVDVGGVTINGAGKTNSDVAKDVGAEVSRAVNYFAQNCLLNGMIPTETAKKMY